MSESKSNIATSSMVEELAPKKRGTTSVVWRWFGYKRSDVQQTTVIWKKFKKTNNKRGQYNKLISPHQAEASG